MNKTTLLLIPLCLAAAPCTPAQDAASPAFSISVSGQQMSVVDQLVKLHAQTLDDTKEILLSITDKAGADAAADKIKVLWENLGIEGLALEESIPSELADLIKGRIIDKLDAQADLEIVIGRLGHTTPPYFGSSKLNEVLGIPQSPIVEAPAEQPQPVPTTADVTTPAPAAEEPAAPKTDESPTLTGEQMSVVKSVMDHYQTTAANAVAIVASIKDKESATAAAPKLKECFNEMDELCDLLETWAKTEGVSEAVDAVLVKDYQPNAGVLRELEAALVALSELEVPFYGSNDLEAVLMDDDEADAPEAALPAGSPDNAEDAAAPEVELTPEQKAKVDTFIEQDLKAIAECCEILGSVKDKETADAAVPKIKALVLQMDAAEQELTAWAQAEGLTEKHLQTYYDSKTDGDEPYVKLVYAVSELAKLEVPFYGSNDLEAFFTSQEPEEGQPEAAPAN